MFTRDLYEQPVLPATDQCETLKTQTQDQPQYDAIQHDQRNKARHQNYENAVAAAAARR